MVEGNPSVVEGTELRTLECWCNYQATLVLYKCRVRSLLFAGQRVFACENVYTFILQEYQRDKDIQGHLNPSVVSLVRATVSATASFKSIHSCLKPENLKYKIPENKMPENKILLLVLSVCVCS